ncbi:carbohydrate ABC transporter permease [Paenibacillus cymbidii]|uniref:carbohydrate ABC transporter permease n=1 Tax=Paenibacillus cymbidii TaxID=1639034 RepID=UPI0010807049|nr:carbohydrate ABC transporter permease [Paenibacillus cymbidii]
MTTIEKKAALPPGAGAGRIRKRGERRGAGELVFHTLNYTLLALFTLSCVFPFLNTFANAFSDNHAIKTGAVTIYPIGFTWDPIKAVLADRGVMRSLFVTVFVTVVGTALQMLFTTMTAYPLSRKELKYRSLVLNYIIVTMVFSGGLIPGYLLIKSLGMLDSLAAIIVPALINSFNMIVLKTFFQGLPEELREASKMDGCGNIRYVLRVALPLSLPAIATISLFYAVGHWNSYFAPLLYIDNPDLQTLQVKLRAILLLSQTPVSFTELQETQKLNLMEESLKSATIVFATVPILLVYPFLQKYFVKGVMIGAVKG